MILRVCEPAKVILTLTRMLHWCIGKGSLCVSVCVHVDGIVLQCFMYRNKFLLEIIGSFVKLMKWITKKAKMKGSGNFFIVRCKQ
jgi:hypothetical protein